VLRRSVTVPGFRAAGVHCGLKQRGLDLALIVSDVPASAAGVFTRSSVPGAPVVLSRERLGSGRKRGVIVNSGISNVAMGARGARAAEAMTAMAARAVGCRPEEMLVASTGVIGEPIPLAKVRSGVALAREALGVEGLSDAACAIMTTDTFPKLASRRVRLGRRAITVAGIAKGSGMIEPRMATMLGFILTDAPVATGWLRRLLRETAEETFNRVSVDGETSTSDMVLMLANGVAGGDLLRGPSSPGAGRFAEALLAVCNDLARDLARDGEGATKLVMVRVAGARSDAEAERAARRIGNSLLVKTALFGGDPNWGRILQTVGAGEVRVNLSRAEVRLGGVAVFRRGASAGARARARAGERLAEAEIEIRVDLGAGRGRAHHHLRPGAARLAALPSESSVSLLTLCQFTRSGPPLRYRGGWCTHRPAWVGKNGWSGRQTAKEHACPKRRVIRPSCPPRMSPGRRPLRLLM
jgi:glutamate N-acetyltransferase/amino-acid N-acetyltransferase